MRILLDTNAYAALGRRNFHIRNIVETADEVVLSTIVLGELHAGFALGSRKKKNKRELGEFLKEPGITIAPPTEGIAERYGEVVRILRENGTPLPTNDIWIAATALETGSRILSFDTHFGLVPGIMLVL